MSTDFESFLKKKYENQDSIRDIVPLISPNADLSEVTDIDAIIQSLINILLTPRGSYIFDPEYGSELYKYVFEPCDENTESAIKSEINSSLMRYENRASISPQVVFLKDHKGFCVTLVVNYKDRKKSVNIFVDEDILKTLPPDDNV